MADERLLIEIDAKMKGAIKAFIELQKVAENTEDTFFDFDKASSAAMKRISDNIDKMADEALKGGAVTEAAFSGVAHEATQAAKQVATLPAATKQAGASLAATTKNSNSAALALSNLGRVAQDAPFGFIGIQNNLNPLLESFQRLRAESGSTGGALKALVGSLAGGGGIGLALSAITAAVSFASIGFQAWGRSANKASEEVKKAEEVAKVFTDTVAGEIVKVNVLAKTIGDVNAPMSERLVAIKELRKEYPAYLKGLTDEEALTKGVALAARAVTIELIRRAVVMAQAEKINKIVAESLEKVNTQYQEQADILKAGKAVDASGIFNRNKQAIAGYDSLLTKATNTMGAISKDGFIPLNESQVRSINIFSKLRDIIGPLIDDLSGLGTVIGNVGGESEKASKKAKKAVEEVAVTLRKLTGVTDIGGRNGLILKFGVELDQEKVKKAEADLKKMVEQIRQQEAGGIVIPVKIGPITVPISQALSDIEKARLELENATKATLENLSNITTQAVNGAISAMATGIGDLISGASTPFQAFFQMIAAAMKQFGEALVAFAVGKIALDKLFKNPYTALAAGFGLIVLSQVVKNFTGPKLAEGGIVNGPTLAMVGDNPGKKEAIIPIEKWDMLNGGGQVVVMETVVRGQDLLLVQDRARASFRRTNG